MAKAGRAAKERKAEEKSSSLNLPPYYKEVGHVLHRASGPLLSKAIEVIARKYGVPQDYMIPEMVSFEDDKYFDGDPARLNLAQRRIELNLSTLIDLYKQDGRGAAEIVAFGAMIHEVLHDLYPSWSDEKCNGIMFEIIEKVAR